MSLTFINAKKFICLFSLNVLSFKTADKTWPSSLLSRSYPDVLFLTLRPRPRQLFLSNKSLRGNHHADRKTSSLCTNIYILFHFHKSMQSQKEGFRVSPPRWTSASGGRPTTGRLVCVKSNFYCKWTNLTLMLEVLDFYSTCCTNTSLRYVIWIFSFSATWFYSTNCFCNWYQIYSSIKNIFSADKCQ